MDFLGRGVFFSDALAFCIWIEDRIVGSFFVDAVIRLQKRIQMSIQGPAVGFQFG